MMQSYLRRSINIAWHRSIDGGLTWAPIVGIGLIGALVKCTKGVDVSAGSDWLSSVGWAVFSALVTWIVFFFARLIFVAPYQLYKDQQLRIAALEKRSNAGRNVRVDHVPSPAIIFGTGDGFERLEHPTADSRWRIVLIAIENSGDAMATNCELVLEWFDNSGNKQLFANSTNFTVSSGRKYFCSIASYDEAKFSSPNKGRIKLHFLRGAFDSQDFWPVITKRHYVTLRFSCSEIETPIERVCVLHVEDSGRLRLEPETGRSTCHTVNS
jgi:hypothetical protein